MSLNLDIIGKKLEAEPFTYDRDTVILYALGIGAGVEELDFIYEKDLKVLPTFAVVPFIPTFLSVFVPKAGLNLFKVLHGEQTIILHKPIAPAGTIHTSMMCESIYDKGDSGAVVNVHLESRDDDGDIVFENRAVIVDRGAGGFGGARGPKTEKILPPEGKEPDFVVEYAIPKDQAALYRLSGDKNPLHIDPEFAQKGGFEKPILHGLCTYGYAGRAIVQAACNGDAAKLKSFSARFMNVVFPGETLVVSGWQREDGHYIVQVKAGDGRIVLGNALAALS
ncbi:MAG: MaoC/PaaZ C-terminal domain-containing protein [Thermodesulfobacteriota bacterium]